MRILLLEDDPLIGDALQSYLSADGHRVDWVLRCAHAEVLLAEAFDFLLLDWSLPDGSGIDLLRRQRRKHNDTPALILTAKDQLIDRIDGLDSGADDFLVKPFELAELSARMRAVSRRLSSRSGVIAVGDLVIDLNARQVARGQRVLDLTRREWDILEVLARRLGKTVGKNDLEAIVLGTDATVYSNALEVHLSRLRKKVGVRAIQTVRGLGYRLAPHEDLPDRGLT